MHLLLNPRRKVTRPHAISAAYVFMVDKVLYKVLLCIYEPDRVIKGRSPPPVIYKLIEISRGDLSRLLLEVAGKCVQEDSGGRIRAIFPHPQMYGKVTSSPALTQGWGVGAKLMK